MASINVLKDVLLVISLVILSLAIFAIFFRAVFGPTVTDRIVGINMVGTKIIIMICLVAYLLKEEYLVDVAIIYALINFVSMIVLTYAYYGALKKQ